MQFSTIVLAAASAASFVLATPVSTTNSVMVERDNTNTNTNTTTPAAGKSNVADDGMDVAACETNVAAQQTACLATCSTAACYTACGTQYTAAYQACAALA